MVRRQLTPAHNLPEIPGWHLGIVPAGAVRPPGMTQRAGLLIGIEAAEPEHHMRVRAALGEQMRTADGTESAKFSRRRFEARKELLAGDPVECFARHRRDAGKRRAMRPPARLAMAMHDGSKCGIRYVPNATAQAMASEHVNLRERTNLSDARKACPSQSAGCGPTYSELGRSSRPLRCCSRACAVQPAERATAKMGVNAWRGMANASSRMAV